MRVLFPTLAVAAALAASAVHAQSLPEKSDYVCAIKADDGTSEDQVFRIDLQNKAWCTSKDGCREIKTIFGVQGTKVVLESSQLEVASFESSIDRSNGAYASSVTTGLMSSRSAGACKPAPFTAFPVAVDGSKIRGG